MNAPIAAPKGSPTRSPLKNARRVRCAPLNLHAHIDQEIYWERNIRQAHVEWHDKEIAALKVRIAKLEVGK